MKYIESNMVNLVGCYWANISRSTAHKTLNLNFKFSNKIDHDLYDIERACEVLDSHNGAAEHAKSSGMPCFAIRRVVSTPQIHRQAWQYSYYI